MAKTFRNDLFKEERKFINANVKYGLSDLCDGNLINNLPSNFINSLYNDVDKPKLHVSEFDVDTLFPAENSEDFTLIKDTKIESIFNFEAFEKLPIANLISKFGKDAFGMYLPFHYHNKCFASVGAHANNN